jgi:hypothetical protein
MELPGCSSCFLLYFSPTLLSDLLVPLSVARFLTRLLPAVVFGLALLLPTRGRAQIVDDSTKVLYGAKTTRVLREADIMREQYEGRLIDTTLTNQTQARNWFHDSTFQQDLGNVGTASRRLLWEPNTEIGVRYGRTVFDKYVRNSATIPYYDTRSPFTFFRFIQSAVGEQVFELSYTRSLGKNLNVGLAYERFASRKILAALPRENLVEHNNVLLFARYQTQDDRYHALFNVSTARHRVPEQGGIRYDAAEDTLPRSADQPGYRVYKPKNLFDYEDAEVYLTQALNAEDRDEVRLVHTLRLLGRGLTAYHIFDWKRQFNNYTDRPLTGGLSVRNNQGGFYPRALLSNTLTNDRSEYRQLENTVGVMGHTPSVEYRLYGRHRGANLMSKSYEDITTPQGRIISSFTTRYDQIFLGGTAGFRYRNLVAIETAGEVLAQQLNPMAKSLSEFWGRVTARLGPISGEFYTTSYSPTLTQQRFEGNHYRWNYTPDVPAGRTSDGTLRNTLVNQLTGRLSQKLGPHYLDASVTTATINDLVYYNQQAVPAQLEGAKVVLTGTLRHRFNLGKFFFDNQATGTIGGEGEGLRIPKLVANGKAYYQGYLFKKAMFSQVGAEVYYQSRFKGYDYSPSTQQFYLQDHFTIRNYSVADVFFITDIKTVSVFLKVAYVNQGLYSFGNGYFATPLYSGLPRRFQFGIRWQFFD